MQLTGYCTNVDTMSSVVTRGLKPISSDIFKQQHGLLMKVELTFINTCTDHVKSGDASLKQYIFLQNSVYSMPKYLLQA